MKLNETLLVESIAQALPVALSDEDILELMNHVPKNMWTALNRADTHEELTNALDSIAEWVGINYTSLRE